MQEEFGHRLLTDKRQNKIRKVMKAICRKRGSRITAHNLHQLSERHDDLRGMHGSGIAHVLPLLVKVGALDELDWSIESRGYRHRIAYRRKFKEDEIETYIDKIKNFYKETYDGLYTPRGDKVLDI